MQDLLPTRFVVFPSGMGRDLTDPLPADLDDPPAPRGQAVLLRLQRNMWLFILLGASFIVGKPVTRLLESYRGVVLDVQNAEMYVAFADRAPRWVPQADDPNVQPGVMIDKQRGAWNVQGVEPKGRDLPLLQLFSRYTSTYNAVIVRIDAPLSPGMSATATIEIDGGKRLRIPLGAENLATAAAGRHLRKLAGSWDPILLDELESR